jgi:hypothetical protein
MTRCTTRGLIWGSVAGSVVGLLAYLATHGRAWAQVKRVGLGIGLGVGVGALAGFATKHTCESGQLSPAYRGMPVVGTVPRNVRCPRVPGVPDAEWRRGIEVELEHTRDRDLARCIAAAHLKESPRYYTELTKMERRLGG